MPEGLQSALDQLWARFLPEIAQRIALVAEAAQALAASALSAERQSAAHAAAHKLAGTLGTFGLAQGTALAREAEQLLSPDATPAPAAAPRLAEIAARLRTLIASR
jgi:HPt (histidine-containing phosphotransfer) domain-containing protein